MTITLMLTGDEAMTIYRLLMTVSGCPTKSLRGEMDNILEVLDDSVFSVNRSPDLHIRYNGSLSIKDGHV